MRQVAIITKEQKDKLIGQQFMTDVYFNPIQDLDGNWVISSEEIDQSEDKEIISFKDLRLRAHQAKKALIEEPPKEEPPKEEPIKEEPPKEEPIKEEPIKEEPIKEEPPKEEPPKKK
jgi:outer membrane biosynthesis protein TonB